jgi:hypothetical protein
MALGTAAAVCAMRAATCDGGEGEKGGFPVSSSKNTEPSEKISLR